MKKELIFLLVLSALAVGGFFLFKGKKEDETPDLAVKIEPIEPTEPPPPTLSIGTGQVTPVVFYDPEEGVGLDAVIRQSIKIVKNAALMAQIRRENGILPDFLKNTSMSQTGKSRFKEYLSGQIDGFISYENAPILPSFVEPLFYEAVKEAQAMGENWNYKGNTDRTNAAERMLEMLDFTRFPLANYKLFADGKTNLWKNYVDSSKVYGDASNDSKTNANYRKFGLDAAAIAKNIKAAISQIDEAVKSKAIEDLRFAGWKFLGDLP